MNGTLSFVSFATLSSSVLLLTSCGAAAPSPARPAISVEHESTAVEDSRRLGRRQLDADATFGDLVAAARALDERRDQDSDSGCLLRANAEGYRLDADLAVAVRPLPPSAADLDSRLASESGPIAVLTRFGTLGNAANARSAWVALTTSLPSDRGRAVLLILTDQGLYARRTDDESGLPTASRLEWLMERQDWTSLEWVVVSAESGRPLSELARLLRAIPSSVAGHIVLATPLEPGTRLPGGPSAEEREIEAPGCPEGMPELPSDAPLGDLPADAIVSRLQPLRSAAEVCVGVRAIPVSSPEVVTLAVRIDPAGRVAHTCISRFATHDPSLHACLIRAVQGLSFAPPGGYVDFELPLRLAPGAAQRQLPFCSE